MKLFLGSTGSKAVQAIVVITITTLGVFFALRAMGIHNPYAHLITAIVVAYTITKYWETTL